MVVGAWGGSVSSLPDRRLHPAGARSRLEAANLLGRPARVNLAWLLSQCTRPPRCGPGPGQRASRSHERASQPSSSTHGLTSSTTRRALARARPASSFE